MTPSKKSETVPKLMQEKYDAIVAITDEFSRQYLNEEYGQLIRFATAALCRKRPSPLAKGRDKTWACGITHAIGMVNFLFDPSQTPHMSATELYKAFGVSTSTGQAKSKQARDTLDMKQMDPNWGLPSQLDDNLMAWMISVNGFIMDARSASREIQEIAVANGLIPYIPGEEGISPSEPAALSPKGKTVSHSPDTLYILDVGIISGPMSQEFIAANPAIVRKIEIKGRNTLKDLHQIIFKAFDREEEHMYEFQIGGQRPNDPKARRYILKSPFNDEDFAGYVSETTLASLGLSEEEVFGYWFDFGDDWWHQVNITVIKDIAPKGKYPKVTEQIGASPPQYADL